MANFWRVATDPATRGKLLKALQETRYSWGAFQEARERRETYGANQADKLRWAVDTFILNRQSFNGKSDHWSYLDTAQYKNRLQAGLPKAFEKLQEQKFKVYNMNALQVMEEEHLLDNPAVFMFLDPPYLEGLRCDGKLYQTDMPDVRDHIDLLKTIRHAKARIVLSGYWSGRDDGTDLYDYYLLPHGWHRHLLGEYTKGCEHGEEKSKGTEWVWCNYALETEAPGAIDHLKSYCADKTVKFMEE